MNRDIDLGLIEIYNPLNDEPGGDGQGSGSGRASGSGDGQPSLGEQAVTAWETAVRPFVADTQGKGVVVKEQVTPAGNKD